MSTLAAAGADSSAGILVLVIVAFVVLIRVALRLVGFVTKLAAATASLAVVAMAVGGLGGLATLTVAALR
ncbi:hypothetical protein ATK36_0169 [Amycolatopsis sulphurea]|uniref:Uncharacterized protein n=1 Tax=Amycolatopsis sulphurea TaxID=76022 RepID=A0A2A9G1H9_9PSEU|nr:hypothetical protein [Amycolatopsis sulphurea]PFG56650.1 hypothetical protein ATK36_0169 [Amycolatopsis sulphurea]